MEDTDLPFSYQINTQKASFSKFLHTVVPNHMGSQNNPHLDQIYFTNQNVSWCNMGSIKIIAVTNASKHTQSA